MDQKNIMKVIIAMMFFMVGCVPKSANDLCPDVQGTYIIDGSHEFFIKKNATGQYKAIVTIDDSYRLLSVDIPTKEELKQDNLPACSIVVEQMGALIPSSKKTTDAVLGTPFFLIIMYGYFYGVSDVNKTTAEIPTEIVEWLSKSENQ